MARDARTETLLFSRTFYLGRHAYADWDKREDAVEVQTALGRKQVKKLEAKRKRYIGIAYGRRLQSPEW